MANTPRYLGLLARPGGIETVQELDRVLVLLAADVDAGRIGKASAQVTRRALRLLRRAWVLEDRQRRMMVRALGLDALQWAMKPSRSRKPDPRRG
jgi:hypothetical protein